MVRLCAASGLFLLVLGQVAAAEDHSPPVGFVPTPAHTTHRFAPDVVRATGVLLMPNHQPGAHRQPASDETPTLPRPRPVH